MIRKLRKIYFARPFLRRPGQSNQIGIGFGTAGAGFFAGIALMSFSFWFFPGTTTYVWMTSLIFLAGAVIGIVLSVQYASRFLQGLEGEKYVYDELLPLVRDGWHIINSFPGDNFDIDFVLVGPGGIFAVEVKNPSKYGADDTISFHNGKLWLRSPIGGYSKPFTRKDPIKQVRRASQWLKRYLSETTGWDVEHVRSLILFPGFMVNEHIEPDLLVLNPKRFVSEYAPKIPEVYDAGEMAQLAAALRWRVKAVSELELAEG